MVLKLQFEDSDPVNLHGGTIPSRQPSALVFVELEHGVAAAPIPRGSSAIGQTVKVMAADCHVQNDVELQQTCQLEVIQ